ncbi:MAG TPA: hypothetical protein VL173_02830 [Vicinamibacterales bacterium]|jgi:hypothetical protein|nr:hypothetical protein [Vicinamibacterales bacterium]
MAHGHSFGSSEPLEPITAADEQYMSTPEGAAYEHTDANVWQIIKFGIWLAITALVVHVGLGLMYRMQIEQAKKTGEERYPLASTTQSRLPPEPRLQQFPRTEYYQFRVGEQEQLESYGWINKDAGVVHIPIEQAMKLALERGVFQSRPAEPGAPEETPGLMPSDASSGRVMERRRQ